MFIKIVNTKSINLNKCVRAFTKKLRRNDLLKSFYYLKNVYLIQILHVSYIYNS